MCGCAATSVHAVSAVWYVWYVCAVRAVRACCVCCAVCACGAVDGAKDVEFTCSRAQLHDLLSQARAAKDSVDNLLGKPERGAVPKAPAAGAGAGAGARGAGAGADA